MTFTSVSSREGLDELLERLAGRYRVDPDQIIPFVDHTDMLSGLLRHLAGGRRRMIVAGYASPEIALAADRCELAITEVTGASPFVNHPEDVLEALTSEDDLVYLANPNWVTGAGYSFNHLDTIIRALPKGRVILDEKLHDYFGITGLSLLDTYDHLAILRSLSVGLDFGFEGGCLLASPRVTAEFRQVLPWMKIRSRELALLADCLADKHKAEDRLTRAHDQSFYLATELNELDVQNRLTSADFVLLRVAQPSKVSNYLASLGLPTENLEGYEGLDNYLRYRTDRPDLNEQLLTAFRRMPTGYYRMDDVDRRAVMFHRTESQKILSSEHKPTSENRLVAS